MIQFPVRSTDKKRKRTDETTEPESERSLSLRVPQPLSTSLRLVMSPGRLFHDGLHIVCQFLRFNEFAATCGVNQNWARAGRILKQRKDAITYSGPIDLIMRSHLRIHISHLILTFPPNHGFDSRVLGPLHDRMGHLESLTMITNDHHNFGSPQFFTFPPHLQHLKIWFKSRTEIDAVKSKLQSFISGCVEQIASQAIPLVCFAIQLAKADGVLSCPPQLASITTLTDLTLPWQVNRQQQVDLIKLLPNIRRWSSSSSSLSNELIQRLADGPPPQLEDIGHLFNVDTPMAHQLKRISSLTQLDLFVTLSDPTIFLPNFSRLSILALICDVSVNMNHLSTALSACVTITDLHLEQEINRQRKRENTGNSHKLTTAHLSLFLPNLTSLTKLKLVGCVDLASLEFLTISKKSLKQLRNFSIVRCRNIPNLDYSRHLCAISQSLQFLTIDHSSTRQWDTSTITRWTPGSNQFRRVDWPQLIKFSQTEEDDYTNQVDMEDID